MATIKSEYYRFNGSDWDLHYFKTSADLVIETASYKVMTAAERTKISDYLTTFNAASKLAQIESGGKLPSGIIPALGYLPLTGGSLTGDLNAQRISMSGNLVVGGTTFINGIITSDNASIQFSSGLDNVNFNGVTLINLGDPYNAKDATTKEYVDGLVAVSTKPVPAVKVATTANVTLSGLTSHDGYTLVAGDRILVWKQTTASQNGIYTAASGAWTKVAADSVQGSYVFVENGNTYNDWYFYCQNSAGGWIDHGRPDTIKPGAGLTKSGTTLSIASSGVTNAMLAGSIADSKIASFGSAEQDEWVDIEVASATKTLRGHFDDIYSAIRLLRGTPGYASNNSETINGAYALANTKNKTQIGATVPGTSGYNAGDLFFKTLA